MSAKEPYISAKEPYISAREPYISAREPYISAIEPYTSAKEPYKLTGTLCMCKESCIGCQKYVRFCVWLPYGGIYRDFCHPIHV